MKSSFITPLQTRQQSPLLCDKALVWCLMPWLLALAVANSVLEETWARWHRASEARVEHQHHGLLALAAHQAAFAHAKAGLRGDDLHDVSVETDEHCRACACVQQQ